MADSTIQVLEGLFATSETVEDANTGATIGAKGLSPTSSPVAQPAVFSREEGKIYLMLGGFMLIWWLSRPKSRW